MFLQNKRFQRISLYYIIRSSCDRHDDLINSPNTGDCHEELFKEALEDSPIIAAVKDDEGLSRCLTSDSRIIFILYGDIVTISDIVETVKSAGKLAIVHLDLINGLSSKEVAVDFLQKYTNADGIITTKPTLTIAPRSWGSLQSSGCF